MIVTKARGCPNSWFSGIFHIALHVSIATTNGNSENPGHPEGAVKPTQSANNEHQHTFQLFDCFIGVFIFFIVLMIAFHCYLKKRERRNWTENNQWNQSCWNQKYNSQYTRGLQEAQNLDRRLCYLYIQVFYNYMSSTQGRALHLHFLALDLRRTIDHFHLFRVQGHALLGSGSTDAFYLGAHKLERDFATNIVGNNTAFRPLLLGYLLNQRRREAAAFTTKNSKSWHNYMLNVWVLLQWHHTKGYW